MNKIIDKFNIYVLYTALFVVLSVIVFFTFITSGNAIVILEAFCAGISFILYCTYNKKSKFSTAIGALVYSFSGYLMYAAVRNPVTTLATIFLPLILLGVDGVLRKNNYLAFIFASVISALSIIWDIYPIYITTIFALIYIVIKYFNEYKGKNKIGFKFIKMGFVYVLAILLVSIIGLHTANIFELFKFNPDFSFTYYDFNYIIRGLFMSSNTAFWCKAYILPIVLTMLPIAVLNFKKNKENRTWILYFLIILAMFTLPWISYILNGFSFEPNKWGFVFSFVLAYIVTLNLRNDLIYSPREFKFAKKMLILYLIVWFIFKSRIGTFALISVALAFVYLIILLARSLNYTELKKNQQLEYSDNLRAPEYDVIKSRVKIVLVLALSTNIIFFSWHLFSHLKYSNDFTQSSAVNTLKQANYTDVNFEFDGKHKSKIVIDNNSFKFTKKYSSINLKVVDSIPARTKIYLVISNLKFSSNNQYTVTAKYDDISSKKTVRDFIKTPNYIKVPDIVLYLGKYNTNVDTIKLTLSKGSYTFDSLKIIAQE